MGLDFQLWQPSGELASYVQGIWSVSVADECAEVQRWLQADACSGVVFNLGCAIDLDGRCYSEPILLLPTSQVAHSLTLPPGAQLAGIRFQPGVCTAVFGAQTAQPVASENLSHNLQTLASSLRHAGDPGTCPHRARINAMRAWLDKGINFTQLVPAALLEASQTLQHHQTSGITTAEHSQSPRQMERLFQRWLGISPKRFQRVLRVQKSVDDLKQNPALPLVDLALQQGFADQAHMTREFKQIARITPRRYRKLWFSTQPRDL